MTLPAGYAPGAVDRGRVEGNLVLDNAEYHELTVRAPAVARRAVPGQFVHVRLAAGDDPLLRRPFSISGLDGDRLTLLFKKVGSLTRRMAELAPGAELDVLGPLGHGYDLGEPPVERVFLIGGGYGVAPLLVLARELHRRSLAGEIHLLVGAREARHLLWRDRLAAEGTWLKAAFATDDGSAGFKGTALDLLADRMKGSAGTTRLYACGPMRMLAALATRWPDVPTQVAVENQMGCGVGVCLGCVLPVNGAAGVGRYERICCDGPVFDGRHIDWAACPAH